MIPIRLARSFAVLAAATCISCAGEPVETDFVGEFVHSDPRVDFDTITRAVIFSEDGITRIALFRYCVPTECECPATRLAPIVRGEDGSPLESFAMWGEPGSWSEMTVRHDHENLEVHVFTRFLGGSGRPPLQRTQVLVRTDTNVLDLEPQPTSQFHNLTD